MKRFNKVLCVVDPDNTMDTAITQSLKIAKDHQADITFISVAKDVKPWRSVFRNKEEYAESLKEYMQKKRSSIEAKISSIEPSIKAEIVLITGIAFIEIIKYAVNHQHDLVVKCAEDMDWVDAMLGSEDMHLIRKCPTPVLMLKQSTNNAYNKVLATVDVSDDFIELDIGRVQEELNQKVIDYSATISMPELLEMHIGCAWDAYAEDFYRYGTFSQLPEDKVDHYVEQKRRKCLNKLNMLVKKMDGLLGETAVQLLQPRSHLVKGKASKVIPLMVEKYNIDLIVMGTVGRVGIPGLIIGNTAESILEKSRCSVLAIKPDGFKTPVE